ncbi:hemagglutinin [Bdellovibrio sp. HCB185ZH]|uniref:hemagglutinin n=1 Tax=Bdellovibrio sp. HCB185ZH TaxID=3394235 RepID=UPI0039A5F990
MFTFNSLYVYETVKRVLVFWGLSLFLLLSSCTLELTLNDIASQAFFTLKPASYSASNSAVFEFESSLSSKAVYKCSLDGADWYSCGSPESLSSLSSGLHIFKVMVLDTAGKSHKESSVSWIVDTDAPILTVSQMPTALNNLTTASFNFEATDAISAVVGYECQHTTVTNPAGSFSSCTPLVPLVGLTQDTHTYKIRAIDSAGNRSAEFSYSWTVDLTAPTIQLTSKPSAATTSTSATFNFTNTETGGGAFAGYECKIDSDPYAACTSGISFSSLSQGSHSFVIKASDTVGNIRTLTYSWIVDSGVVTLSSFSIANGATTIGFAYTTTQLSATSSFAAITGMRFSELADFSDASWVPYSANGTVTLKNPGGLKTIYAQVRNAAGTVSNSLTDSITLDLGNPPIMAISSPVGGQSYTPGSSIVPIQWSCSPGAGPIPLAANPIRSIKYTVDDGVSFHTIAENLPNNLSATTGSYSWNLPGVTSTGQSISASMPLKILVSCTSEAGVITSAISNAVNSKWTVLVGEPGNLNDGVHINAADLTANVSLGAFGYFADSQNKMYFTKFNSISTVNPETGLVTSWMGEPYSASCDIAGGKFTAPVILDINESDQMLVFSFACSLVARIRISDKTVLWSKQLPTIISNSAVLHKEQASALRYVKTGHLFYFSNEAFYMVDLNSANKDPVLVLGNPGACGTLGAVGTMADASPIPCPTSDLYLTLVRPDLQKIWIQINGSTFELQQQGAYGKYKIAQVGMTTGTWGSFFNRCTQMASQPNKAYCIRAQYEGNKIASFDFTTETWSASFNLDKHYKNMSTIYYLGAAKDFIYAFSTTTNELYKVVDDEGVFTNSAVAGTPFFTYGNGTDPGKTAFTQISSIAYEATGKNLYVRGPRHLRRLHVNTTTPGSEYIDTISTGFHGSAGNSSAYASLTVSSGGIAAFSQIAGTPANLWSSYNLSAWATATVEQTLAIGPYYYQATSTASAYPAYGAGVFNTTGTSYNLMAARKLGTFLPNGKLYFYGSSSLTDQTDLWIFESDSATGKIKPIAGGAGAATYVATDHGQLALGSYLSDIYGMQPDANGDLLVFDGNRLRKITVTTESANPRIYDVINFAMLPGAPTVSYWTHAVYDTSTGWSYFAAAESSALSQVAQVWAAHPTPGFQQISTAGWVLPSQLATYRSINLAVTPLGLLLLDTSKKRILKTGLLPTPP